MGASASKKAKEAATVRGFISARFEEPDEATAETDVEVETSSLPLDAPLAARLVQAELFTGFPEGEMFGPRPASGGRPPAVLRAVFTVVRATGVLKQMQEASAAMHEVQTKQAAQRVIIVRDVPYVRPSDVGQKHMLDIYLPVGERRGVPLIVHFHGGGCVPVGASHTAQHALICGASLPEVRVRSARCAVRSQMGARRSSRRAARRTCRRAHACCRGLRLRGAVVPPRIE
jgi:hypothetical protein